MGGRLSGRGLTHPHGAGLEGGARLVSVLVGMLLIGAGLLHISAAGDHTNLPVMLAGFLVVAVLQAGLGGLLVFRRAGRLVLFGGLALTFGALATWLVSRTVGLPFLPGGHMEPIGFKDGVCVVFEIATLPFLALLASSEVDRVRLPSPRLGAQSVAVLGSLMFALLVPALVLGGGEHHSHDEMGHMHDHDAEELAHADGHAHAHGSSAAGGHEHGDMHEHGHEATPELLASAHDHATGEHHDLAELGLTQGAHEHSAHTHSMGESHDPGTGDHDHGSDEGGHDHGDGGHDHGDGGHDDGGDETHDHGSDGQHEAEPAANQQSIALESGRPAQDGRPARGPAVVVYDRAYDVNGESHAHEPCDPTAEQQAAADRIVTDVSAELKQYENNPAEALADGFNYVFGPTDRMLHMVNVERVDNANVLKAPEIESFIYYMTDTGFVPIGGMFVMPRDATSGPQPGGCLTQWHHHGGFVGRWATAGTSDTTPLMMHVFTYPGLDPWGHYDGRDLAALWTPGSFVPSVCRSAEDANNGCLP